MTPFELGWLVGIIEGEGYLGARRCAHIKVCMTDRDVIERVATLMGARVREATAVPGRKQAYVTSLHGQRARTLAELIQPHLGDRRAAAAQECIDAVAKPRTTTCRVCSKTTTAHPNGRPKLYCSAACRSSQRRLLRNQERARSAWD